MNSTDARVQLAMRLKAHLARPEFSLSFPQQRPWFLDELHKDNSVYNLPVALEVRGPLDAAALRQALAALLTRHDVLRTTYHTVDGVPKQRVGEGASFAFAEIDLSGSADPKSDSMRVAGEEARRPFNLATGPMIRATLLRRGADDHLFFLTLHHIACDAWSVGIIAREISAAYAAFAQGKEANLPLSPLQYVDFVEWQKRTLTAPMRTELLSYWRSRLAGISACVNLPTDRPRPPVQDYSGAHVGFDLPAEIMPLLDRAAQASEATPFAVMLAVFCALLARHAGDDQIVVGTPVANRNMADLANVVGFFTNTLVLRPDLARDPSLAELVSRVGAETREALAHQDLPFEILVEELRPDRDTAHSPVFQVMFIYWDGDDDALWSLTGCDVKAVPGDSQTSKFDLTLSVTRTRDGIRGRLEYATALFDQATAQRLAAQYETFLVNALKEPAKPLSEIDILPVAQQHQLREWAQGAQLTPSGDTVHALIQDMAAARPGDPAVVDARETLSYAEVEARASAVAGTLRSLGVGPGAVVGIYLDRSAATVVALYGVLKAGAAYLPLDPAYPADRLSFMCSDSEARVILTDRASAQAAASLGRTIVCVENCAAVAAAQPHVGGSDDLAYLIYTSGSTGKPKGVMITHANVMAFFAAMDAVFRREDAGTWMAVTSISFDISVLELLWTLARGFKVVIHDDEIKNTARLSEDDEAARAAPVFSLFFFGNSDAESASEGPYDALLEAARFADANDFTAVWVPERHFHPFGGLFPNPSVLAAALAASTRRIGIRAGSVVLPLHDPLRVAEEWAVVDQLSRGRVGISFASGWQPNDFVLQPDNYADRKELMFSAIDQVRGLWRGEAVSRRNGAGAQSEVRVFPRPRQAELPVWVTSARHPDTFRMAGERGARLLTHLVGHSVEQLGEKIAAYRTAWREHGWPGNGYVTLMVHTFVDPDMELVRQTVRGPLREYIRSSFDLMAGLGDALKVDLRTLPASEVEDLLDVAFERFLSTSSLLGTPDMVEAMVQRLNAVGVDEMACLCDFGVPEADMLAALPNLDAVRRSVTAKASQSRRGPESLPEKIARHKVTHFQCTPSLAGLLVADPVALSALAGVRHMLVGGEALPPALAATLSAALGGKLHNMYGPTEATVWATTAEVVSPDAIRIGKPLPGYAAWVVDRHLRPVPVGVPGELLLGGPGISRGYHARPELTADRFVANPFGGPGERLYRTGDLVRWREPGALEFLGRMDFQVKIRGRRIELGEIDAALATHPSVTRAVTDVRGTGDRRAIVAFCVAVRGQSLPGPEALRSHLARSLPDHMLPASFVVLDALPLTPNGKVDRRALPDVQDVRPDFNTAFIAPAGAMEEKIATVWRDLLRLPEVGTSDNFFELGGNSILAVKVRSQLIESGVSDLTLIDMFRFPTIASLADAIGKRAGGGTLPVVAADAAALRRRDALSRKSAMRAPEAR